MLRSYEAADFDRAVGLVGAEPIPRLLVERLRLDWEELARLARDASEAVLGEATAERALVVSYGGEAFKAGFLIGVHLPARGEESVVPTQSRLAAAVDAVQERGRHAVIADHCDLESVARLETVYAGELVESMDVVVDDREALRAPVTRIFEAGLAVGLGAGSGGDGE
ncbi:MAG TPA: hypothetical protein VM184_03945 [Gaiellaceae bacterium]|nr:hypothetical protein [Gaiellaceae bacterium]